MWIKTFAAVMGLALSLMGGTVQSQNFPIPGKTMRIIVPFTPGGQTDTQARFLAQRLTGILDIPVVVENKPGASTIIGAMEVVKAQPDGHTLLYTIAATAMQNPHLFSKLPYSVEKDLTPIMFAATSPMILVASQNAPFKTFSEMMKYAKENPNTVNFASTSAGGISHLNGELLKSNGAVDIVHIPFKGTSEAMTALLGGHVHLLFDGPATAIENAKAGKVHLLAIADERRSKAAPHVPTLTEEGVPGVDMPGGMQFFGPGNMPPDIADQVNAALKRAINVPEMLEMYRTGGNEPMLSSAAQHKEIIETQSKRWGKVIRQQNIRLD